MAVPTAPLGYYPQRSIPVGLYLEPCDRCHDTAPWSMGKWHSAHSALQRGRTWQLGKDGGSENTPRRNDSLYQIDWDPFIASHATQLVAFLVLWYENLQPGNWDVDQDGVMGGTEKYREANLEEHCVEYVVEIGPELTV